MFNRKNIVMISLVAAIILLLWCANGSSTKTATVSLYSTPTDSIKKLVSNVTGSKKSSGDSGSVVGMNVSDEESFAPASLSGTGIDLNIGCTLNSGVGLASSLLPREVASQEDFGQFAPDDILKGQNFLDPRNQIGIPETLGGNLRNANQQIRADPPNPKKAYEWNNSTIVPDLMQRKICT